MTSESREMPIWRLVELAAKELTKLGQSPFQRGDLIKIVRRSRANCGEGSINPIIQGMTDNLRGGAPGAVGLDILHSVGRGLFVLKATASSKNKPCTDGFLPKSEGQASRGVKNLEGVDVPLSVRGYSFSLVCEIRPKREPDGSVAELNPQGGYENRQGLPLHKYGSGPFCSFRVPVEIREAGVYILTLNGETTYIGECANLSDRFNMGYGQISPRNCFKAGQETNCRINKLVLEAANNHAVIRLWFLPTQHYKTVERELLRQVMPPWNRR